MFFHFCRSFSTAKLQFGVTFFAKLRINQRVLLFSNWSFSPLMGSDGSRWPRYMLPHRGQQLRNPWNLLSHKQVTTLQGSKLLTWTSTLHSTHCGSRWFHRVFRFFGVQQIERQTWNHLKPYRQQRFSFAKVFLNKHLLLSRHGRVIEHPSQLHSLTRFKMCWSRSVLCSMLVWPLKSRCFLTGRCWKVWLWQMGYVDIWGKKAYFPGATWGVLSMNLHIKVKFREWNEITIQGTGS